MDTKKIFKHIPWVILGIIGAFCLAVVALRRGEHVSALWIVVASVSVYLVAYRYYSLYIAQKVMKLDPTRATPAVINNDGLNYVPTNRYVCLVTTSPLSPVLVRWWVRFSPRRWATCLARCGCWRGSCWQVRFRTLWCCLSPLTVTAHLSVR